LPIAALGVVSVGAIALLYRPLLFDSVMTEVSEARGVSRARIDVTFLLVVALATSMTVPVVGAFLMFSLMIAPAAAARSLTDRPGRALALSAVLSLLVVWVAIIASYISNWPIGFFVGTVGALAYALARGIRHLRRDRANASYSGPASARRGVEAL
jgi:zinc/manganese transport system permease protein